MKYRVYLDIIDDNKNNTIDISYSPFDDQIDIHLHVSPNDNIDEILSKDNLKEMLVEIKKDYIKTDPEVYEDSINAIDNMLQSDLEILPNTDYIVIVPDKITADYINRHKSLNKSKFLLGQRHDITHEDLDIIDNSLFEIDDVYVLLDGNQDYVLISEYKKTIDAIDEIVNKIKKYDLSPLEQLIYAYDLVRDRVYTVANKGDRYSESRDLTKVLFGDKIVCAGFANIFDKVVSQLGLKSIICILENRNDFKGHARNIVYLEDEKYGIKGVYYFDPTWDSKKKDDDNSFLNSYKFFARNKNYFDEYDKNENYTYTTFNGYDENLVFNFEDIVKKDGIKAVPEWMRKTINSVAKFIDDDEEQLISYYAYYIKETPREKYMLDMFKKEFDLNETLEKLDEYDGLFFYSQIPPRIFLWAVYNVRKIEYYEDSVKYPFSKEVFKRIMIKSGWAPSRLELNIILGEDASNITNIYDALYKFFDECYKFIDEKEIEQVKLVKTLQRIRNSKTQ